MKPTIKLEEQDERVFSDHVAKKATSEVTNGHSYDVSLASLIAAKKLAESLGGVEEARLALNALAKLG